MTRALQNFGRPGCCLMLAVMLGATYLLLSLLVQGSGMKV